MSAPWIERPGGRSIHGESGVARDSLVGIVKASRSTVEG